MNKYKVFDSKCDFCIVNNDKKTINLFDICNYKDCSYSNQIPYLYIKQFYQKLDESLPTNITEEDFTPIKIDQDSYFTMFWNKISSYVSNCDTEDTDYRTMHKINHLAIDIPDSSKDEYGSRETLPLTKTMVDSCKMYNLKSIEYEGENYDVYYNVIPPTNIDINIENSLKTGIAYRNIQGHWAYGPGTNHQVSRLFSYMMDTNPDYKEIIESDNMVNSSYTVLIKEDLIN